MTSRTDDPPNRPPPEATLEHGSYDPSRDQGSNRPGASHPMVIEPYTPRIVVRVAGRVVADTISALTLGEAGYPPIHYIPRNDVDMTLLVRSEHSTFSPYKGLCTYYSIPVGGPRCIDSVWSYEDPYPTVLPIKEHLAFFFFRSEYC